MRCNRLNLHFFVCDVSNINQMVKRKRLLAHSEELAASDSSDWSEIDEEAEYEHAAATSHASTHASQENLQREQEAEYLEQQRQTRKRVSGSIPRTFEAIQTIVGKTGSHSVVVTDEQAALLQHAPEPGERVLVQAFAGSGKTTLCRWLAYRFQPLRVLYLAYNKIAAAEAKTLMPDNVDARTIHSLALLYLGGIIAQREAAKKFARITGVSKQTILNEELPPTVPLGLHSELALRHFSLFCRDPEATTPLECVGIALDHEDNDQTDVDEASSTVATTATAADNDDQVQSAIMEANRAWKRMQRGLAPYSYDALLKQFTMDGKKSLDWLSGRYDVIIVDEAQDSQGIFVRWLQQVEHLILFAVGDRFQSIYSFNGTVNAMCILAQNESTNPRVISNFNLTRSFRFGSNVGHFATHVLKNSGLLYTESDSVAVRGNTARYTVVRRLSELYSAFGDENGPIYCIARQNKTLIAHALNHNTPMLATHRQTRHDQLTMQSRRIHFFGNVCAIVEQVRQISSESLAWRRAEYKRLLQKQAAHKQRSEPNLFEWEQQRLQAFRAIEHFTDDAIHRLLSKTDIEIVDEWSDSNPTSISDSGTSNSSSRSSSFGNANEHIDDEYSSDCCSLSFDHSESSSDSIKQEEEKNQMEEIISHIHYGTIHSSKGLQFDRVAILDDVICVSEACKWLAKPRGTPLPKILKRSINSHSSMGVSEADQIREEIHLVYVALTRAKQEVFVNDDLFALYQQLRR